MRWALEIGYRHVDTASLYGNEESVAKAIADSGIDPEVVFVTTKVWNTDQGYRETLAAFDASRRRLDRDVVDLYLIHWPIVQKPLLDYCREKGIQFEAWSPLTRGRYLDDPVIQELAAKHGKTPAQILLRWNLEHRVVTIPKSVRRERILENSQVFDFSLLPEDVARLDGLDRDERIGPHPDEMGA